MAFPFGRVATAGSIQSAHGRSHFTNLAEVESGARNAIARCTNKGFIVDLNHMIEWTVDWIWTSHKGLPRILVAMWSDNQWLPLDLDAESCFHAQVSHSSQLIRDMASMHRTRVCEVPGPPSSGLFEKRSRAMVSQPDVAELFEMYGTVVSY